MIYLLTGASHTGKTALAQKLLERLQIPYLSIDHLKMGLIRSGQTDLTPEDDEQLTAYLWPIVREMIKTAIENRQNLMEAMDKRMEDNLRKGEVVVAASHSVFDKDNDVKFHDVFERADSRMYERKKWLKRMDLNTV